MITRPRARHVQQMPLSVVHLLQIGFIAYFLNPVL